MLASTKVFHEQRSCGRVSLGVERLGLQAMREASAAKVRFPQGGNQTILINTGGGMAGGDDFGFDIRDLQAASCLIIELLTGEITATHKVRVKPNIFA